MEKIIRIETHDGDFIEFNGVSEAITLRIFAIVSAIIELPEAETCATVVLLTKAKK